MMGEINDLIRQILQFRDERDWKQFHNPKDLAISLSVESFELLELFLWKSEQEIDRVKLKDELADVFYAAFLLADAFQLDVKEIIESKLAKNEIKYPVDKAKGSNKKYDEL
jgi:NTP pyrophosphatase (non-canonical NTP hydrolase)